MQPVKRHTNLFFFPGTWELLPKVLCLSYIIFLSFFVCLLAFLEAWKQLFVSGQHAEEESPCSPAAQRWKGAKAKRQEGARNGGGAEQPVPRQAWTPGAAPNPVCRFSPQEFSHIHAAETGDGHLGVPAFPEAT